MLVHPGDPDRGEANSVGHLRGLGPDAAGNVNRSLGLRHLGSRSGSRPASGGEVDVDVPFWRRVSPSVAACRNCSSAPPPCKYTSGSTSVTFGSGQTCPWLSLANPPGRRTETWPAWPRTATRIEEPPPRTPPLRHRGKPPEENSPSRPERNKQVKRQAKACMSGRFKIAQGRCPGRFSAGQGVYGCSYRGGPVQRAVLTAVAGRGADVWRHRACPILGRAWAARGRGSADHAGRQPRSGGIPLEKRN